MDDDKTITPEPVDTGADTALPVETSTPAADTTVTQSEPSIKEGADTALPDEKLISFAKGQGIDDLSDLTAREKALLKSAYDSKADRDRVASKTSELEKTFVEASNEESLQIAQDTGQNPELIKTVRQLQVKSAMNEFFGNNPEAREYSDTMRDIALEKGIGDLDALYAMAVVRTGGLDKVKSQGKREALTNLAHKQQATAPIGNATTSTPPKEKPFTELSIAEMESKLGFVRR
jgi:hypothetical protein